MKSVPPLEGIFNQVGMKLPDYLGDQIKDIEAKAATKSEPEKGSTL